MMFRPWLMRLIYRWSYRVERNRKDHVKLLKQAMVDAVRNGRMDIYYDVDDEETAVRLQEYLKKHNFDSHVNARWSEGYYLWVYIDTYRRKHVH